MKSLSCCKLEIFIPKSHLEPLRQALQSIDAGHIGNYDSVLSYSPVTSFWRPLEGTSPYIGTQGQVSCEPEIKAETVCLAENLEETIRAIRKVHPYEEPVINVIMLHQTGIS